MDQDRIYQRIGEFVVCFQFLENQFREIGWFILDPARQEWPPLSLGAGGGVLAAAPGHARVNIDGSYMPKMPEFDD